MATNYINGVDASTIGPTDFFAQAQASLAARNEQRAAQGLPLITPEMAGSQPGQEAFGLGSINFNGGGYGATTGAQKGSVLGTVTPQNVGQIYAGSATPAGLGPFAIGGTPVTGLLGAGGASAPGAPSAGSPAAGAPSAGAPAAGTPAPSAPAAPTTVVSVQTPQGPRFVRIPTPDPINTPVISSPVINAEQTVINPGETTEGILDRLLSNNSPYLQRAQSVALQNANGRGLLNSSIAAGAGTAAAIDAALGVAGPDAQIYSNTRLSNTAARNDTNKFNASNELDTRRFNASNEINVDQFNSSQAYDAAKTNSTQENAFNLAQQDVGFRYDQLGQQNDQFNANLNQNDRQFNANLSQQDKQFLSDLDFRNRQLSQSGSQFDRQLEQQNSQFIKELASRYDLTKLQEDSRMSILKVQNELQSKLNTDSEVANQYRLFVDAMFKIDSDTNLEAPAKAQRKREQLSLLRSFVAIRGLNLDFSELEKTIPAAPAPAPAPTSGAPTGRSPNGEVQGGGGGD